MSYTAPLKDMLFNIEHLARINQVAALPGFETRVWKPRRLCWRSAPSSTRV